MDQDHLPYITKLLTERLRVEKNSLNIFEKALNSDDELAKRQAAGNIPSNKGRIQQLENALEHIKGYKPTDKQPQNGNA